MTPERFEEIVSDLVQTFKNLDTSEQELFLLYPKEKLTDFHHSLGRHIRNEYGLWEEQWEAQLVDGVDYSPNHPDAVSMRIIEEVWVRVHL